MSSISAQARKVYFELTNACNFRCDFCPITVSQRKAQMMDLSLFKKGVDDIVRDRVADTVGFHILGEPLLYPRLYEAIDYAKCRGLQTELHTNGALLTRDRVHKLLDARLDELVISVQVIGDEEHESRGARLSFGEYYAQVMGAVRGIHERDCDTEVTLCVMNTATTKLFDIDRPMRLNGDRRSFKAKLLPFVLDVREAVHQPASPAHVEAALARLNPYQPTMLRLGGRTTVFAQPFADWGNAFTEQAIHPARVGFCGYGLSNIGVLSSGQVTICCADYDGHTALGNLRDAPLAELLASEQAVAIREGFDKMRLVHPYCQRCVGSPSRTKALFKGLMSIYLFKLLGFEPAGRIREVLLADSQ